MVLTRNVVENDLIVTENVFLWISVFYIVRANTSFGLLAPQRTQYAASLLPNRPGSKPRPCAAQVQGRCDCLVEAVLDGAMPVFVALPPEGSKDNVKRARARLSTSTP